MGASFRGKVAYFLSATNADLGVGVSSFLLFFEKFPPVLLVCAYFFITLRISFSLSLTHYTLTVSLSGAKFLTRFPCAGIVHSFRLSLEVSESPERGLDVKDE